MSENLQAKPGQLVMTDGPQSQTDQMFSGLGLSSYVKKRDTGALATKMMDSNTNPFPAPPTSTRFLKTYSTLRLGVDSRRQF